MINTSANQYFIKNQLDAQKRRALYAVKTDFKDANESDLKDIKGIGVMTIELLRSNQINNKSQLLAAGLEKCKELIENPLTIRHLEKFFNSFVTESE